MAGEIGVPGICACRGDRRAGETHELGKSTRAEEMRAGEIGAPGSLRAGLSALARWRLRGEAL